VRLRGWVALLQRPPQIEYKRPVQLDDAVALIRGYEAVQFTPKEMRLIEETLEYTRDAAPVMLGRVADSVLNQLRWHRLRTFHHADQLQAAIAAERSGNLVPETAPILLSSTFASAFRKRLFSMVYERLYRNLPNADLLPEAASDVFVDFLVRLGDESSTMSVSDFTQSRHAAFLRQLCDRTSARLTGQPPENFVPVEETDGRPLIGLKKSGLYDAVLKEVGDRLRALND
jgi:hypothetical protein